jgi:hypothetical protein
MQVKFCITAAAGAGAGERCKGWRCSRILFNAAKAGACVAWVLLLFATFLPLVATLFLKPFELELLLAFGAFGLVLLPVLEPFRRSFPATLVVRAADSLAANATRLAAMMRAETAGEIAGAGAPARGLEGLATTISCFITSVSHSSPDQEASHAQRPCKQVP